MIGHITFELKTLRGPLGSVGPGPRVFATWILGKYKFLKSGKLSRGFQSHREAGPHQQMRNEMTV